MPSNWALPLVEYWRGFSSTKTANLQESNNPNTWCEPDALRIVKEIRSGLLSLSTYGVCDSLHFAIKDRTVIVEGYASRPILKSDAERVVKRIQGVESVDNQIEVLPLSPNDDRIRATLAPSELKEAAWATVERLMDLTAGNDNDCSSC